MVKNTHIKNQPSDRKNHSVFRYLFAVIVIILAASLRLWPLGALELRIPWVTFYPAVMATALYGGFFSGILATALSALLVLFWSPTNQPFIDDFGDWLGMAVFSVNGSLISLMSGAMHRANERANKSKEQAVAANQAKSVFLANMSHELRSPLNAILGFTHLMRKASDTTNDQTERLNIIAKSGENLLSIINNVLDISKIEAGHMIREDTDVNLKQLLHDINSMISIKVMHKGFKFNIILSPDLPETIVVDSGKLRQILTNLITNAVKFTEKGEVSLNIKVLDQKSTQQIWLRFEVKDSGRGIQKEDQERIFAPFKQICNQPNTESGTGLGLAICKQFVDILGGHIGILSTPGKGSTFHFEIPVNIPAVSPRISSEMQYTNIIGLVNGQKHFRILIAEDKMENRLLLRSLLQPLGFEIREAVNGLEAVEQFKQWRPHLICMDIRMPVMSGLEATRLIKSEKTDIDTKIIALTAHALEEERIEIMESGCDDFIRKPYRDSEIFGALSKHLNVRFLYGKEKTPNICNDEFELDMEPLKQIKPDLLENLRKAAVLLDENLCFKAIGIISDDNHFLGSRLRNMVENLQYKKILTTLDSIIKAMPNE